MNDEQPDQTPADGEQGEGAAPGSMVATYRDPYDTESPITLRDRIIYARELANSGLLPRDYVGKPANVLVAAELGAQMGLAPIQAVLMLNVVEGRPTLGAGGVRAVVQRAGHTIGAAEITYNKHGMPVEASVYGQRVDTGQEATITWNIARAHRAGLCHVQRDDEGEVVGIRARSQNDKVKPWEAHTEDMLDARATTKLGRVLFGDVTMGLSYERDELDPVVVNQDGDVIGTVSRAAKPPTARAEQVLQTVAPTRRTDLPDDYDPSEDALLFSNGDEWYQHAGAQVSRRSKLQLAADRIAKWVTDNPDQDVVPLPPAAEPTTDDDTVDAVIVEDPPADPEPGLPDPHDGQDPWATPGAAEAAVDVTEVTDAAVAAVMVGETPAWEDGPPTDQRPTESLPDDGPDLGGAPDLALTAAEYLAEIDAAASELGRTRQALMVRWIATHRKNPDEATAEELLPFVEQLRTTLAARKS